jgi:tRNA-2-methylthio-N6-dimethylallyladenosine synthase
MGEGLLRKAPYVDLVMGPDGYRGLPEALEAAGPGSPSGGLSGPTLVPLKGPSRRKNGGHAVLRLDPTENYEGLELRRSSSVSAWVPIQRGCNHRCTFCIVPFVRGPEKNREPLAVLEEVREVAARGITEVTLLGQTVNSYRIQDWDFSRLLQAVARTPGIERVRFTSPHPNDLTPELVEVMAGEPAVCEQLHLPLQAGNDRTLKRMLRRHTVGEFLQKIAMIRDAIPDVALSTDVIVAFPGETEADFRDTLSVLEEVRFDDAFTYRYSPRDGTPATRFPEGDLISEEEGRARLEELIQLTRGIQKEINEGEVGRREEVLVEKEGKEAGFMLGRTRRNKVVVFPGRTSQVGSYRTLELIRTTGATFVGSHAASSDLREPT